MQAGIFVPSEFAYISFKAAKFFVTGAAIYRKNDFFHYPLEEWNAENIKNCCKQILEDCAGVVPDCAIRGLASSDIRNTFELFHFTKTANEADKNTFRMDFIHKIGKQKLSVYYDLSNIGEDISEQYLSVSVERNIIKLSVNPANGVIKIYTDDENIGVAAEYAFIRNTYPEYQVKAQRLQKMEIDGKTVSADILEIAKENEIKELRFDISGFFSL
jgi:hypothetical protein